MSAVTASLFPAPPVPPSAASEVQLACTGAVLAHRQLGAALARPGWTPESRADIERLRDAALSLHEQLRALLAPVKR